MKHEVLHLVRDTLSFLKEEGVFPVSGYTNYLKKWEFGKEAPHGLGPARGSVFIDTARVRDQDYEVKPTMPKTNSSSSLCIPQRKAQPIVKIAKKSPPPPEPLAESAPLTPPIAEPVRISSSMYEKIHKHLPHLSLIKEVPTNEMVAILLAHSEDRPFLENLAKAIEERFCKVKILDDEQMAMKESFKLFLVQKEISSISKKKQILLAPIEIYRKNKDQKKLLWSSICTHLSPKSSWTAA